MARPISRRTALQTFTGAAALAAVSSVTHGASPAAQPVKTGKLRQSVCRWCYNSMSVEDLCRSAKEIGLDSVELLNPEDFPTLKKYGLQCAMTYGGSAKVGEVSVGGIPRAWNRTEYHDALVEAYGARIKVVAEAGFEQVICFSGNRDGMDDETGLANCAAGLKRIMATAEKHKITVAMELLNSKVNHKDYQCDHTAWGVELAKRIGSERFKLLYDIYHMQIMEGDVIRTIRDNHQYISHYHTAGNPGRHEFTRAEDVQELNYPGIMRAIADTGYTGFIGQEFVPTRDPMTALKEAVDLCRV